MNKHTDTKIPRENLLRGNWGEQYVSERLCSCDCFVRHVPQGHDTSVDLYCETTSEDKMPFIHFWCQVKTSKNYKGKKSVITINQNFNGMNVHYWLKQPIPVFIFVVPDLRNQAASADSFIPFYIFPAIDFFPYPNIISIKSLCKIENSEHLKDFLINKLLIETFRWDLMRGKVSHLLLSEASYSIKFPKRQTFAFENNLQESLRWTLRILADDILDKNDPQTISNAKPYVEMLETLACYIADKHYETYEVIGDYYRIERRSKNSIDKAKNNYDKSLDILNSDQKVSTNCAQWRQVIENIKSKSQHLKSKTNGIPDNKIIDNVCATTLSNN